MIMKKMITCKVCGTKFPPKIENRYVLNQTGLNAIFSGTKLLECFDCPDCGCQNVVNIREGGVTDDGMDTSNEEQAEQNERLAEEVSGL